MVLILDVNNKKVVFSKFKTKACILDSRVNSSLPSNDNEILLIEN